MTASRAGLRLWAGILSFCVAGAWEKLQWKAIKQALPHCSRSLSDRLHSPVQAASLGFGYFPFIAHHTSQLHFSLMQTCSFTTDLLINTPHCSFGLVLAVVFEVFTINYFEFGLQPASPGMFCHGLRARS